MEKEIKSRASILEKIRLGKPGFSECPLMPDFLYKPKIDLITDFQNNLASFDGHFAEISKVADISQYIQTNYPAAHCTLSLVNGYIGTTDLSEIRESKQAALLDLVVVPAQLGVAETGSVWLTDKELKINTLGLLPRDLVIVLSKKNIVGNLHDAYRCISLADTGYGSFYSGPSATADIEAIHVTGAQGILSLTVLLLP